MSRSTLYRRRRPVTSKPKRRPRPQRALDTTERERVLSALHCERFVDKAPAQVWATFHKLDHCMRLANFLQPGCFGRLHVGRFKSRRRLYSGVEV